MMKMSSDLKNVVMILAVGAMTLTGCKKDLDDVIKPAPPSENELITTLKLLLTNDGSSASSPLVFTYKDMDGDGPATANPWDTIMLWPNTIYSARLLLLDETKKPVDTISYEVEKEGFAHQFFYKPTNGIATVAYNDRDKNGVPVGLLTKITPTSEGKGSLNIVLKHQPDTKPKTGNGDETKGSTDINITFGVRVKAPTVVKRLNSPQ